MRTVLFLAALVAGCASNPPTGQPTCASFDSQASAQAFYEAHVEHFWVLDPNQTGTACKGKGST